MARALTNTYWRDPGCIKQPCPQVPLPSDVVAKVQPIARRKGGRKAETPLLPAHADPMGAVSWKPSFSVGIAEKDAHSTKGRATCWDKVGSWWGKAGSQSKRLPVALT